MQPISVNHPLRRLFAGLVEHAFCAEVGMCDPSLTDYVAGLLVDFTHIDRLNVIRNTAGKPPAQVASMLAILDDEPISELERDRAMYRRLGDYTLFWAGVYPEQLRAAHRGPTGDLLPDYVSQGKQSYLIVSRLAGEDDTLPASLFRHLSEDFEFCLYGLGVVRRGLEQVDHAAGGTGGDLLY